MTPYVQTMSDYTANERSIDPAATALLLTFAALWDHTDRPVHVVHIARRCHVVVGLVSRQLRECPLVEHVGQGFWKPQGEQG